MGIVAFIEEVDGPGLALYSRSLAGERGRLPASSKIAARWALACEGDSGVKIVRAPRASVAAFPSALGDVLDSCS